MQYKAIWQWKSLSITGISEESRFKYARIKSKVLMQNKNEIIKRNIWL